MTFLDCPGTVPAMCQDTSGNRIILLLNRDMNCTGMMRVPAGHEILPLRQLHRVRMRNSAVFQPPDEAYPDNHA